MSFLSEPSSAGAPPFGERIARWSMLHRKWVFRTLILMVVIGTALISRIQVDTDPENMLPTDHPARVTHEQIKHKFGLSDMVVVGVVNETHPNGVFNPDSLAALDALSRYALTLDGVVQKDLMSLNTVDDIKQLGEGTLQFRWMMAAVPETLDQAKEIQSAVRRLPMLNNTLVSDDGKAAAIYVPIVAKKESYRIAEALRAFTARNSSDDKFYITGLPVAEDTFGVEMFVQMAISAPGAALMIFLLMWGFFRSVPLVTSPMLMAMAVVLITMGAMIGAGFTVHIMSSMIPIFLMPIAVVDSVHILSEFSDHYRGGENVEDRVAKICGDLFSPMLYTSLTSAIGFASLAMTPIPPVQAFGMFVAFGILLAFVLTVTFIPAYIAHLKPASLAKLISGRHPEGEHHGRLAKLLKGVGSFSIGHPKTILSLSALVVGFSVAGLMKIQINDNPVRWFAASHDIRVADRVMNDHFAGTYEVYLSLTSDQAAQAWEQVRSALTTSELNTESGVVVLPKALRDRVMPLVAEAGSNQTGSNQTVPFGELLTELDNALFEMEGEDTVRALEAMIAFVTRMQREAHYFQQPEALTYIADLQEALQKSGQVGKSNSLADLVKTVYRELKGEGGTLAIPATVQGVADTLLSFQSSHRPQDLWHMVTPDYQSTVIWLQLNSGDNQDMEQVMRVVQAFIGMHPLPDGLKMDWGGLTHINVVWQEAMVSGMLNSLLGSFVMVFVVMVVLFRSVLFGLLAMLPLTVTILFIYGLIGWVGKDYDMPIAVLSSLTLGLSVDFAIHFLQRAREISRQTAGWAAALPQMFDEPARAIGRNALVIALGFTPLLLAPLVPYNTVGVFLATIMLVSCLVTLMVLPASLQLLKARFLK